MNEHSRSIDLRHHSIRQDYEEDGMRIGGVSSKDNTNDILTKFLQPELHHIHTNQLYPPRPMPIPYNRQTSPTLTPPVDLNTSSSHDDKKDTERQLPLLNLVTRLSHLNLNGRLPVMPKINKSHRLTRYLTQSQQLTQNRSLQSDPSLHSTSYLHAHELQRKIFTRESNVLAEN